MPDIPVTGVQMRPPQIANLRQATIALEANFLAEMLKSAGMGKPQDGFGGGIGEDQFASFLVQEQARAIAERGGVGLAEQIFNAMQRGKHDE